MNMIDAIILGALQGASEFLPISSSAHLVIGQALLGVDEPSIYLEVALHVGTLLAVLVYYWKDVIGLPASFVAYIAGKNREVHRQSYQMCWYIILGSIPAGVGGLLFKDWFEAKFDSAIFSGYMLLVTAGFLIATHFVKPSDKPINAVRAFLIGVAQFCAILPGISRSGSTIAAGLFQGIDARAAARFSFLLSVPAVAGAVLLKALDLSNATEPMTGIASYVAGALVSFVVGVAAIYWLLKVLVGRKLYLFGFYCLLAGLFTIIYI